MLISKIHFCVNDFSLFTFQGEAFFSLFAFAFKAPAFFYLFTFRFQSEAFFTFLPFYLFTFKRYSAKMRAALSTFAAQGRVL